MTSRSTRIGAAFYALWGLIHILGGLSLLITLASDGGVAVYKVLGSAVSQSLPDQVPGVTAAVAGFHAWNMLWIGALVLVVAVRQNWRGRPDGFWLSLCLAGAADLGLVFGLLVPGYMRLGDGMIGVVLFLLALSFTMIGRRSDRTLQAV